MSHERVLIVEDEKLLRWSLRERLERDGYEVIEAATGKEGLAMTDDPGVDLLLLDQRLPDTTGIDLLKKITSRQMRIPVIMMTAYSTLEIAGEAVKLGVFDYINKPFNQDELAARVSRALESARLKRQLDSWQEAQTARYGPDSNLGRSPGIQRMLEIIRHMDRGANAPILLLGRKGSCRDLVARCIHHAGERAGRPFVELNCSSASSTLLESALMGHELGASSEILQTRQGLIEQAQGGTLFLDDIEFIDETLQSKLRGLLETRKFRRVGGVRTLSADVRIITGTSLDLRHAIGAGKFDEELHSLLATVAVDLPPLRDRREDVPSLAAYFVEMFSQKLDRPWCEVSQPALGCLMRYPWPGDVLELRNTIERAMFGCTGRLMMQEELPRDIRESSPQVGGDECPFQLPEGGYPLEAMEREMVKQALRKTKGNQTRAAKLLSISRDALRYKMKKYRLF